jgi:hypothetical protein
MGSSAVWEFQDHSYDVAIAGIGNYSFSLCFAGGYNLLYFFDGNDIFIHGKERDPPPILPDLGFLPLQPDGFVLDRTRVKLETVLRVIVHKRPVFGCDHEPSVDLRHLGIGDPGSDRIGDKIAVEG